MSGLVVIGAGPGIARSVASRFAREGLEVSLVARRREPLERVAEDLRVHGVRVSVYTADAGDPDDLSRALRTIQQERGTPDAVAYNAGLIRSDAPGELTPQEHLAAWCVNVLGALVAADATIAAMAERGSGTFLVTGGMPVPDAAHLSLSLGKAGVRALVQMLADHYRSQGVHVATVTVGGAVAPGTAYDAHLIAEQYWRLHRQPPGHWETEVVIGDQPAPEGGETARSAQSRRVVRDYLTALQRGDLDAMRASFTPDATWSLRGDLPVSGTWTGQSEILDTFFAAMTARLDVSKPLSQEVTSLVAEGDTVVAEWTSRATTAQGETYENDYAVVFVVRDGRIAAVREYFDTAYAQRVLFGEASVS